MKRAYLLLLLLCILLLVSCSGEKALPEAGTNRPKRTPTATAVPTETPTPTYVPTPSEVPTETPTPDAPKKLDAGAVGLKKEDIVNYYCRVGLTSEYTNGNVIDYVRKWQKPIVYIIEGTPNPDDLALIESLQQK